MEHIAANYERYATDLWAFMTECVHTIDQIDSKNPIKLFPNRKYLRLYCKIWENYPLLVVPKSRRMTMSWTMMGIYAWKFIFRQGQFIGFVSKKEDDADELVKRVKHILDNIPEDKIPKEMLPDYKSKYCYLGADELNNTIRGFPQGADQMRQFTFSDIFGDEAAFWEKAKDFYAAAFPTIDGGGRMTIVSSPAPGFFKKLCFDAIDSLGDINVAEHQPDKKEVCEGVTIWLNKKNRFTVFQLHYTADPRKRHAEYKESLKNSMPLQEYLREYELYWDTFSGAPVYPEFSKLHICDDMPEPVAGLPMLIGFDFGLTPAAIVGQFQEETLFIFKEYIEVNMGAERFSDKVIADIKLRWPQFNDLGKHWKTFIDPSGDFRKDTDESTCAQILNSKGFGCIPGPVAWEKRRHAVVHFLQKMTKEGPAMQLSETGCPMLIKGFKGGYRFSERSIELEPSKLRPVKDEYSHPHDALQYLASGVQNFVQDMKIRVPRPDYSFTGSTQRRRGNGLIR